jgi:hypothetical protein
MKKIVKYLLSKWLEWRISQPIAKNMKKMLTELKKTGEFKNISKEIEKKHAKLWSGFGFRVNFDWLKTYILISGISDYRYIPENIFYSEIEPRLNKKAFSRPYADKNNYHKIINNDILVPVLLRAMNGAYYTHDYQPIKNISSFIESIKDGAYIIKPSIVSGGGKDVRKIELANKILKINPSSTAVKDMKDLINYYKRDFVIQEYLEQDSFFKQFNPTSLNTVRILIYRSLKNEEIIPLHRILRIGKTGNVVDNLVEGGIACGISKDDVLSSFGLDEYGHKFYEFNEIKLNDVGIIPYMNSINILAIEVAKQFPYARILSIDFAVNDKGKIFLIEVNNMYSEINFCQMHNGPLFGEYSEEVANLCHKEPKSILFDYTLK